MTIRLFSRPLLRPALLLAGLLLAAANGGCNYFRNLGSGTHLNTPPEHAATTDQRTRVMVVEVTTDAPGQIANIHFTRSSGKEGIDGYVAQTIKDSWPQQPSTRTQVEVTYSAAGGFTQPKILSSSPAT